MFKKIIINEKLSWPWLPNTTYSRVFLISCRGAKSRMGTERSRRKERKKEYNILSQKKLLKREMRYS